MARARTIPRREALASDVTAANLRRLGYDVTEVETMRAGVRVPVVRDQTPLDRLYLKGAIEARQFAAGDKFRIKCRLFMGGSVGVASYGERMARGDGDDHNGATEMDARIAVNAACCVVGERSAAYLMDVCFFECTPTAVGKTLGVHHSTAHEHFKQALSALADFWRI